MQNPNFELAMDHSRNEGNPAAQSFFRFGSDASEFFGPPPAAECAYQNAASCPDCGGGMVRLGVCFSCPSCGFESCNV